MGQWVVTVAGIAILAVLCDIILPDGQTRKYIKTVIGVVVTLVMIQPLVGLIGGSLDYGGTSNGQLAVNVQQSYLDMTDQKQAQARLTTACDILSANGVAVEVESFDKQNKSIELSSGSARSPNNESLISKVFSTYFSDYKIKIEWT